MRRTQVPGQGICIQSVEARDTEPQHLYGVIEEYVRLREYPDNNMSVEG